MINRKIRRDIIETPRIVRMIFSKHILQDGWRIYNAKVIASLQEKTIY